MSLYGTILAATDLSDHAATAVRHAGALAERMGSRLVVAYVVHDRIPPLILESAGQTPSAILEAHRKHAEKSLDEFVAAHLAGRDVETAVLVGLPHDAINRFAEERKVDLIVVGTHGHGFVTHVLMGSTAERILHHAPCPVLVVRG